MVKLVVATRINVVLVQVGQAGSSWSHSASLPVRRTEWQRPCQLKQRGVWIQGKPQRKSRLLRHTEAWNVDPPLSPITQPPQKTP